MPASSNKSRTNIYLGRIYTPLSDGGWLDLLDGALAVDSEGRIAAIGHREVILRHLSDSPMQDYSQFLITPGFIDCHQHLCHYDWVRLIPNLRDWLEHIYEMEGRFVDLGYAIDTSKRFFTDLIQNGTTTACVHGPYFADATDVAFQVASEMGLRVLMGMNAADRNVPSILHRPADISIEEALCLHAKWNEAGDGLLSYCFTVRPAYCASRELMHGLSQAIESLGAKLQCHLAEEAEGQKHIVQMYPGCKSDSEVYREVGLLGHGTIMAHGVYLSDTDYPILSENRVSVIHCPRANLMAGGRQFDLQRTKQFNIPIGLGTDLGGSKGLSMFKAMEDAMKVTHNISIHDVFRMGTLDGALALGLANKIGSLEVGKDADFLVLCPKILKHKPELICITIKDLLSSLIFQGDDRDVKVVKVKGKRIDKQCS